ncbi:hypothetical protein XPA_006535 [Xanthoria parietina]
MVVASLSLYSEMKRFEASRWTASLYRRTQMSMKKVMPWQSWPNSPVAGQEGESIGFRGTLLDGPFDQWRRKGSSRPMEQSKNQGESYMVSIPTGLLNPAQ